MKTTIRRGRHGLAACTALATGAAIGLLSLSADDKKPGKTPAVSEEEAAKAWMEAATPGPAHKILDVWAGEWETEMKMWESSGAEPVTSKGTASAAWIMGGRFMEMTIKATMMGQPFEGRSINGYNNMRKTYTGFWIDNMGTAMTMTTGSASADGKTLTMEGRMDDPMTGEQDKAYKFIDRRVSNDEIQAEIHDLSRGKDSLMMTVAYRRKK